jgi:hypothetical protein
MLPRSLYTINALTATQIVQRRRQGMRAAPLRQACNQPAARGCSLTRLYFVAGGRGVPIRQPGAAWPSAAVPGASRRSGALLVQAAKGFGKAKPPSKTDGGEGDGPSRKSGKRARLQQTALGPIPGQAQQQQLAPSSSFQPDLLSPAQPAGEEDVDFAARLAALKEQNRERAAAAKVASSSALSEDALSAAPAIFDAPASPSTGSAASEDIYANPPSIASTLMKAAGAGDSGISDPKLREANIGPSQVGLAAGEDPTQGSSTLGANQFASLTG